MDTTVRSSTANLSKKQIYDVFDETAKLFEQFGSNFKEKKTINNTKTSELDSLLMADYDDFKEFTLKAKMKCYRTQREGISKCSRRPIFYFFYPTKLDFRGNQ